MPLFNWKAADRAVTGIEVVLRFVDLYVIECTCRIFFGHIRNLHTLTKLFPAYTTFVTDLIFKLWTAEHEN
jgi:hypothetical protein